MKVWLLYENDRPYSGRVVSVFTSNDDVAVSEDMRERLHALDFRYFGNGYRYVKDTAAIEHSILQEVRVCLGGNPGTEWPEPGEEIRETPPLDDIECALPHPHMPMEGCNGVCKHTYTYCNDRNQETCKGCGDELGR